MPQWLSGWLYRKSHEIVGSTAGAQTDYQIRIKVHYGSGTDDGENVYLNGKCRTDFGDVRFTASDGETLLNYWIEEKSDSNYAIFWVKVPSIPASPDTTTIYCYTPDTDVMTENGWVNLKDFVENKMNLKVATLNPNTNKVEYHYPLAYVKLPFKGKIVHFKSRFFDLKVTPEHRMWYKTRDIDEWRFGVASEIPSRAKFKRDFPYEGREQEYFVLPEYYNEWSSNSNRRHFKPARKIRMDDWLKFFGFYISEGSLRKPSTVVISQEKEDVKPLIEEAIRNLGYNVYYTGKEYLIHDVQLVSYLNQFGHAKDKFIPNELKNLSKRQLKILLETLLLGDGSKRVRRGIYEEKYYGTISKRLADDVQEIALKAGYTASIHRNSKGLYIVYLGNSSEPQNRVKTFEEYEGYVYCLIVPNHLLFVRRNGKPLWSGNCYYGNPLATTTSNGDNTFIAFHDMDVHHDGWVYIEAGTEESFGDQSGSLRTGGTDGILIFNGLRNENTKVYKQIPSTVAIAVEAKVKVVYSQTQSNWYNQFGISADTNLSNASAFGIYVGWVTYTARYLFRWISGSYAYAYTGNIGLVTNTWYKQKLFRKSDGTVKLEVWEGDTLKGSCSATWETNAISYVHAYIGEGESALTQENHLDYIFARKYVDPEPSHGAWGSEEIAVTYVSVTDSSILQDVILTTKTLKFTDAFMTQDKILRNKTLTMHETLTLLETLLHSKITIITDEMLGVDVITIGKYIVTIDEVTSIETVTPIIHEFTITGTVKDAYGNPVAGATVWLFRTNDKTFIDETTTNENGVYTFKVRNKYMQHFIYAHKEGTPNIFGATDKNITGE